MAATLLVLNAGSSSLKFQLLDADDLSILVKGEVSGINGNAHLAATMVGDETPISRDLADASHDAALAATLDLMLGRGNGHPAAFVHRIVHGGTRFTVPTVVTADVLQGLEALIPLAPLHQPHNIAGIRASQRLAPETPDVACFDTAFHAGHDAVISSFALPQSLRDKGIRRFGFHGLSYEWVARVLADAHPELARGRVVVAHLGNGASLCALRDGRSIDTTMSLTALDGVPMGTRSGAIDPGAILYLLTEGGIDTGTLQHLLYEESGLKGLSGLSNDMRALLASHDPAARLACDHFVLKVAQQVMAMAVSMGGIDAVVFTGGIGEHAAPIREAIRDRLAFAHGLDFLTIPANEERMMAIHARALLEAR
jgi:acetate kinase